MCDEWYIVDPCENVCDTSTKVGQRYVDMKEVNEHNSVESCMTYFRSRNMRWFKCASGMKEGVCVQNLGDKSSLLYLIKNVCVLWRQRYTVFPYQTEIESIMSYFVSVFFLCQKFVMAG